MTRTQLIDMVTKILRKAHREHRTTLHQLEVVGNGVNSETVWQAFRLASDLTGGRLSLSTTAGLNSISGLEMSQAEWQRYSGG